MSGKILVTYASRSGSTAETAEVIGRTLVDCGAQVEVRPMSKVNDLRPFAAVVAGSAIRGGKWLPEGLAWLRSHQSELARRPFTAFMVCITLAMPQASQYRDNLAGWMSPVRALARPVSEGMFPGVLDFKRLSFWDGLKMRLPVLLGIFPRDDRRDWQAVRRWAEQIQPLLYR